MEYLANAYGEKEEELKAQGKSEFEQLVMNSFKLFWYQGYKTVTAARLEQEGSGGNITTKEKDARIEEIAAHLVREFVGMMRAPERIPPKMAKMRAEIAGAIGGEYPLVDMGDNGGRKTASRVAELTAKMTSLEEQVKTLTTQMRAVENKGKGGAAVPKEVKDNAAGIKGLQAQINNKASSHMVDEKITKSETKIKGLLAKKVDI